MAITRRKFLKHLAFVTTTVALAPGAALAEIAKDQHPQWIWVDIIEPLKAWPIDGDDKLQGHEERLEFKQKRIRNPLLSGKIGIYDSVVLHQSRSDRRS